MAENAQESFPELVFCPTDSPQPKDTQFTITVTFCLIRELNNKPMLKTVD